MREASGKSKPKLASGPIRRWVVGKPRLAATPEITPRLSAPTPSGASSSSPTATGSAGSNLGYRLGVLFRASVVLIVFATIVLAACWAILVATVLATPLVDGKLYAVQRAPWVEGKAPEKEIAYVVSQPVQRDLISRFSLQLGGDDNAAIMEVAAAANSQISVDGSGTILINGVASPYRSDEVFAPHRLGNSYLMVCVKGPCGTPGTPSEVPIERVLGKVLGSVKLFGLDPAPTLNGDQGESSD